MRPAGQTVSSHRVLGGHAAGGLILWAGQELRVTKATGVERGVCARGRTGFGDGLGQDDRTRARRGPGWRHGAEGLTPSFARSFLLSADT